MVAISRWSPIYDGIARFTRVNTLLTMVHRKARGYHQNDRVSISPFTYVCRRLQQVDLSLVYDLASLASTLPCTIMASDTPIRGVYLRISQYVQHIQKIDEYMMDEVPVGRDIFNGVDDVGSLYYYLAIPTFANANTC